jgi:hypothetical protein
VDRIIVSWSQALISSKATGASKARDSKAMSRAAQIRWDKYWEERGGRPLGYQPIRPMHKRLKKGKDTLKKGEPQSLAQEIAQEQHRRKFVQPL